MSVKFRQRTDTQTRDAKHRVRSCSSPRDVAAACFEPRALTAATGVEAACYVLRRYDI